MSSATLTALTGAQFVDMIRDTSGMDAEMVVFADQIQRSSERVDSTIAQIKVGDKARDLISARLQDLREANDVMKKMTKGGQETLSDDFADDFSKHFGGDTTRANELLQLTRGFDIQVNLEGGVVSTEEGQEPLYVKGAFGDAAEAEIQRLEGLISKMDGERQIALVRLNQETNNKSRALSLAVNLLKAKNDSAKMIISALRSTG